MKYTPKADYTTELRLHNGKLWTIKHCGRCLSVIPREVCEHCVKDAQQQAVKMEKFKQFVETKKKGGKRG